MTSDEIYKLIEVNELTLHGDIEHFAALVASAERERLTNAAMKAAEKAVDVAIAFEREACAKVAQDESDWNGDVATIANRIRARGQA